MNIKRFCSIIEIAVEDKEKNIEVLKKALKENDFKICGMGASIMLGEMLDMGLSQKEKDYWETLALAHLPYSPSDALK